MTNIEGSSGIQVHRFGNSYLISASERLRRIVSVQAGNAASVNPLINAGFYAYVPADEVPRVIISRGTIRTTVIGSSGGSFASLDSGGTGTIGPLSFTDLTDGSTGYIIFRYAQTLSTSTNYTVGYDGDVDFGVPDHYFVQIEGGQKETTEENSIDVDGTLYRYALQFVTELPNPVTASMYIPICRLTVSDAGIPSVKQIHIGDIVIPIAMQPSITSVTTDYND